MYVATASPWPKRTAFDGSRGGGKVPCVPPLDPPVDSRTIHAVDNRTVSTLDIEDPSGNTSEGSDIVYGHN